MVIANRQSIRIPPDDDARLVAALGLLEAEVAAAMEERKLPSISAALVHDQRLLWSAALGQADLTSGAPANPETVYRVGSVTKALTATMLMQLRDAGTVHLDDPVERHIPGFTVRSRFPGSRPITLKQLASHTSGLPVEPPLDHFVTMEFPPGAEMAESMSRADLLFMPSTQFRYSNGGFAVLGHALERAAKRPYVEWVDHHILKPLGMNNSGFEPDEDARQRMASPYRPSRRDGEMVASFHPSIGGLVPSGDLYSTPTDLARFISLQFREDGVAENHVLAANSIREMHAPVWVDATWQRGMGIGWHLERMGEYTLVSKGGLTFGTTADVLFIPELRLGMAAITNGVTDLPSLTRTWLGMVAPIWERLTSLPPPRSESSVSETDLEIYAGLYSWPEMELEMRVKVSAGSLVAEVNNGLAVEHANFSPAGKDRFLVQGGSVDREFALFDVNPSGYSERLRIGPYNFERETEER